MPAPDQSHILTFAATPDAQAHQHVHCNGALSAKPGDDNAGDWTMGLT